MAGCSGRHSSFSSFTDTDIHGWAYGDTLTFYPTGLDSADTRTLDAAIRHSGDYMYRNLWLEVSYRGSDSILRRDTVELELADVYGRWLEAASAHPIRCRYRWDWQPIWLTPLRYIYGI